MHSRSLVFHLVLMLGLATVACSRDPQKLKEQYLASGDAYAAKKNYREAIIEYRNAIKLDPRFGEARYKLADAYTAIKDAPNAMGEYVRAADLMPNNIEAQLRAGALLLSAKQFPEAKARAQAALAKEPKNVEALTLLGNSLAGLKEYKEAISEIEEAIESDPRVTLTYTNLGVVQLLKGDRGAAEAAFRRAVEVNPKSAQAHMSLANFYWSAGERADAEREIKSAYALDPASAVINESLATLYLSTGRAAQAETHLKAYADATPGTAPKLALADYYVLMKKTREATDVLQQVGKEPDGFAPAEQRLATIEFRAGRRDEGYKRINAVLAKYPNNEAALLAKARFLLTDQKYEDGLKLAKSIVGRNPASIGGHFVNGVALEGTGSVDEAIKEYREAVRLDPNQAGGLRKLAELSLLQNDWKSAVEFGNQWLKVEPNSEIALFVVSKALVRTGSLPSAEPRIMALARLNPASADIQLLLGDLYLRKGNFAGASTAYARAMNDKTTAVDALEGLVKIDLTQKKPAAARARVESRLAVTPNDPALLLLAGKVFTTVGDSARAKSVLQHTLEVDPSNIEAYASLGNIHLSEKRFDEARHEYEETAKRQPKLAPAAATMIGIILSLQNKPAEAQKEYERALAMDPQSAVAANNLAWTYAENGGANLDQALQLAQTAKARLPKSAQVNDTLGWIYYKKGLTTLAITSLREGATQSPENPSIQYHLGLAYLKNGDYGQARQSLQRALNLNPAFSGAEEAKVALASIKTNG